MRLNFYSRHRRFNKSLLGSHKNAFVLLTYKKALITFASKTAMLLLVIEFYSSRFLDKLAELYEIQHKGQIKHCVSKVVKRYITYLKQSYMVS